MRQDVIITGSDQISRVQTANGPTTLVSIFLLPRWVSSQGNKCKTQPSLPGIFFGATDIYKLWAARLSCFFNSWVCVSPIFLYLHVIDDYLLVPLITPTSSPLLPTPLKQEVVLFVGYPCLGKTSFFRRHFQMQGYEHINQDSLKTRDKCIKALQSALKGARSCVIGSTLIFSIPVVTPNGQKKR